MIIARKIMNERASTENLFGDNITNNNCTTIQYLPAFLFSSALVLLFSDNVFNSIYFNWLAGSRLIKHLANVAILNVDRNAHHGIIIIICYWITLFMTTIFAFVISHDEDNRLSITSMIIQYIIVNLFFFSGHYQCCIFAYMMIIYRRQIYEIKKRYSFMSRFHFKDKQIKLNYSFCFYFYSHKTLVSNSPTTIGTTKTL